MKAAVAKAAVKKTAPAKAVPAKKAAPKAAVAKKVAPAKKAPAQKAVAKVAKAPRQSGKVHQGSLEARKSGQEVAPRLRNFQRRPGACECPRSLGSLRCAWRVRPARHVRREVHVPGELWVVDYPPGQARRSASFDGVRTTLGRRRNGTRTPPAG